jgi:hypothetical protein
MPRPYHPPLTVAARVYHFPHLEPFQIVVSSDKVGRDLRIHVRFSNHCFSEGFDAAIHPPGTITFPDGGGRQRVFSPERYGLSQQLPGVLQRLNHPKAKVWQTAQRRNWLHSLVVDNGTGPYHIFFEMRRAPADERHLQDLNMIVESAYQQGAGQPPAVLGKIGFVLLVGKVFKEEPTATKR